MLSACSTSLHAASYEDWIKQARQGQYQSAIIGLQQYRQQHPQEARVQLDLMRIHAWASQPHEVIRLYESWPTKQPLPADVLLLTARAYKDARQWTPAQNLYREGMRRFPRQAAFTMGLCMSLADAGLTAQALSCAQQLQPATRQNTTYLLTRSYIYRAAGQNYEALRVSQDALAAQPNKTDVIRDYDQSLHAAGLHRQAMEWQTQHPGIFSNADQADRQADYAAELTRLSPQPTRTLPERFLIANRAIMLQDKLADSASFLGNPAFARRIRGDRLIAVDAREDAPATVDIDPARQAQYPDYAYASLASMQLRARHPEQAVSSYERALAEPSLDEKTRTRYQTGLAFSLLESGHEDQALALAERMEQDTPATRRLRGNPIPQPNPGYTDALILKNSLYTYTGLLKDARENLAKASAQAPSNVNLRVPLADAQRISGMPRAAERNLKIAETYAPRQEDVIISQAQTALDLHEYRQAEELLAYAKKHYPTNIRVAELEKDWQSYRKNELILRSGFETSNGGDVSGNDGIRTEAQWYSAPINYHWRATAVAGHLDTSDELGHNVNWQGAGLEYRGRDWQSQLTINNQNWGQGNKMGASLQADHALSDHWSIGGTLDYRTLDIPNRALAADITANQGQVRLRWQNGPEQWVQAAYTATKFSDDNVRQSLQITGNQRIYTGPRIKADARLELWASGNKDEDKPYYSPQREYMAVPALRLEHLIYQHYDERLTQALTLGVGIHHQSGYGRAAVGSVAYELNYQHDRNLEVGLRLQALSRPYDGQREQQYSGMVELKIKF
ncbi:poly-beta-1,6 N-acetyl-D-glucosamine export porin PgaA [Alcaligenes faecalis]|uniref:poly-beta-1,6 N-acetyl-D-glucosamine export porin PgaA n=1 Tax=Alcaligenes faecalis TaxID=511 RepID=UPI0035579D13